MSITFATLDDALAATVQPVVLYGRIGGEAVTITEATANHGVNQPVGTCRVWLEAPRPAVVEPNAEIEIETGYAGASRRIFHGRVVPDEAGIDDRGRWLQVTGEGWASKLRHKSYTDIIMDGPISLKDAFRSLCELRSVPTYLADDTTYVDGVTEIMLGGNDQIDGGNVIIETSTSPLDWLTRTARLFGYRVFDSPDGAVRLARVSGIPPLDTSNATSTTTFDASDTIVKNDLFPAPWSIWANPSAGFVFENFVADLSEGDRGTVQDDAQVQFSGYTMVPVSMPSVGDGWVAAYHAGSGAIYFDHITLNLPTYEEGVNCYRVTNERDPMQQVTYWEVRGATYTATDGGRTSIRSIPEIGRAHV